MHGPAQQFVLLGASNLVMSRRLVVNLVRGTGEPPLRILMACGHGRSYGGWSTVLGRSLPGIAGCGLWPVIDPALPTAALVTDVGNDIMYGAAPREVLARVAACLERLAGSRVIVTGLPMGTIGSLRPLPYRLLRSLLFPGNRLGLDEVRRRAAHVDSGLRDLAQAAGATFAEPDPGWYGVDPIHLRRRARKSAWQQLLASWGPPGGFPDVPREGWAGRPARWRRWGRERQAGQPCAVLRDGSTIAMY